MRAREFMEADDASNANLLSTLSTLRDQTDQIRLDSLVNMVRRQPGSEMFNIDLLLQAQDRDPAVSELVDRIEADETGVKYVYLKPITSDDDAEVQSGPDMGDTSSSKIDPKKTVSAMAKRASSKRI